jgi:Immunoglobulin I-set domain
MRTHRKAVSLLVLSFAMLAVAFAAPASVLAASGDGELARFGERGEQGSCSVAHPTECSSTRAGLLAGAAKATGEPSELSYAIGVDPTESDSVFVLDEPDEPTYHYIKEIKSSEEIITSYIRHFRIQKFTDTGVLEAQAEFSVESPEQEEEEEPLALEDEHVSNIAIDSADGKLYVLATEPRSYKATRDAEAPVAYELLAFSTATLAPAGTGGTDVLAGPSALDAESKTTGGALIEPRGIAVDPKTHEVVILASEDHAGEPLDKPANNRFVLERVSSSGSLGERYIDSNGFFKTNKEGPLGVVVTPGGKVLVRYAGIAEVPYDFSSSSAPVQLQGTVPAEPNAKSVLQEAPNESETGGQLSLSPEGELYESSSVWEYKKKEKSEEDTAVTAREAATGAILGWTGGQSPLVNTDDECVLDPGTEKEAVDVAAGSEGRLFVLAPEYLNALSESFQPHTSKAVIELGPGGKSCPGAHGSAVVVDVNGLPLSEGEPVLDHSKLGLSTEVGGADAIGEEWVIENKKTHKKVLEGPDMPLEFQREETTNYQLLQQPLFEYTFSEPGEYLISGKITSDDLATGQVATPTRTLIVDAAPEVTEQPVTQTDPVGRGATFAAEASGVPAPGVQWEVSTNGGTNWNALSGATSPVLTLEGLTSGQSGYQYRARFENAIGSQKYKAFSAAATLSVLTSGSSPAEVSEQPKSVTVVEGETASFAAAGSGVPAPSIQWEASTNEGKSWSPLSGQTSTKLKIEHSTLADSGDEYRASIKNTGATKTTDLATLTVTTIPYKAPEVTAQPKSTTVNEGQSASFEAAASGTPAPTQQWEVATNGSSNWTAVPGATSGALTLSSPTLAQSGYAYRACFTSTEPSGAKEQHTVCSSAATLRVEEKQHTTTTTTNETPPPPPPPPPPPTPEPTASIASTSSPTVSLAGVLTVKVGCPTAGTHCTGTLTIRTATAIVVGKTKKGKKPKKQIVALSSGDFSISGGASDSLTLHLSSEGRALLAQSHTLKVKATVAVAGGKHTVEELLTLHLAQPKKKKKK